MIAIPGSAKLVESIEFLAPEADWNRFGRQGNRTGIRLIRVWKADCAVEILSGMEFRSRVSVPQIPSHKSPSTLLPIVASPAKAKGRLILLESEGLTGLYSFCEMDRINDELFMSLHFPMVECPFSKELKRIRQQRSYRERTINNCEKSRRERASNVYRKRKNACRGIL